MGLFHSKTEGGFLDVIRCDQTEYLVWKWNPSGKSSAASKKENAIRYGSSLRVKEGELAVFVHNQEGNILQDFIEGPFDEKIETKNFPVLANIIGLAFAGGSPFQAEVYFINLAKTAQIKFAVPFFDIFDPRFLDFSVPVAVRGTITFALEDYKNFIRLNRLIQFDLTAFQKQVQDTVIRHVKQTVANAPADLQIPAIQLERSIAILNPPIEKQLQTRLAENFGVTLKALDIAHIEIDKTSAGYAQLRQLTAAQVEKTVNAQTDVGIKNMQDMQRINAENIDESARIGREEMQRTRKLQTETNFVGTHALNQQADVLKNAAQSLGSMGNMDTGAGDGGNAVAGGMNPAGMMTGMMMGSAMGQQMAGMMNQLGEQNLNLNNQPPQTPPPPPTTVYHVAANGKTSGPFTLEQLQVMTKEGNFTRESYVWKPNMQDWKKAHELEELLFLFASPPPPPPPPTSPTEEEK